MLVVGLSNIFVLIFLTTIMFLLLVNRYKMLQILLLTHGKMVMVVLHLSKYKKFKKMTMLLEHLEDNDDVQNVYHNWEMDD